MTNKELQELLKQYPDDAIVGTPTHIDSAKFKSVMRLVSHRAQIMVNGEVVGETTLLHLHND